MKKTITYLMLSFCLLLITPIHMNAENSAITGYTADGIYYEVTYSDTDYTSVISSRGSAIYVTREITYNTIITPNVSLSWSERINDTIYSGTLKLQSFYYENEKTVATYKGTLIAQ